MTAVVAVVAVLIAGSTGAGPTTTRPTSGTGPPDGSATALGLSLPVAAGPGSSADATRPGATQPDAGRPALAAPGTTQPGATQPGAVDRAPATRRGISRAGAAPLARSRPVRLRVSSLGIDSGLVGLGLEPDGSLEVPSGAFPAGWYTGAPTPGELGPAVLAGHVDYGGRAGVFARLSRAEPGAEVEVTRQDGVVAVFRVIRVSRVSKSQFPTAEVYGDLDHAGLRLITCGGAFSRSARSYRDNIVVYAELVRAAGA